MKRENVLAVLVIAYLIVIFQIETGIVLRGDELSTLLAVQIIGLLAVMFFEAIFRPDDPEPEATPTVRPPQEDLVVGSESYYQVVEQYNDLSKRQAIEADDLNALSPAERIELSNLQSKLLRARWPEAEID